MDAGRCIFIGLFNFLNYLNSALNTYETFTLTLGSYGGNIVRQQCYYNPGTRHVHIFIDINGISEATGTGAVIITVPTKYKPNTDKYGFGSITNASNSQFLGCIMVRQSGAITQSITNSGFIAVRGFIDYYI